MEYISVDSLSLASICVGITAFALTYWFISVKAWGKNLPPGPTRLPFVGTLPFHGFTPEDFTKMGKQYGDIFTIYIGKVPCVILNSYDVIKEALVTKSQYFSDRGSGYVLLKSNPHQLGIMDSNFTPEMRQHRNQALSIFRTLGFGKPVMEHKIQEEAEILVRVLAEKNGKAFDPGVLITVSVANVINSVLYNVRYEHNDKAISEIIEQSDIMVKTAEQVYILDFFPLCRFIPSIKRDLNKFMTASDRLLDFVLTDLNKHYDSHTTGQDSDFVHAFIDKHTNPDTNQSTLDKENLHFMMRDFFIAGMETTTTSTKWMLLLMANNPQIQRNAQEEIDHIVGKDRPVRIADRDQLHYTEAIIWEVQRLKTIVPLSLPHYTKSATTLAGYDIPGKTQIIPNISHVHMDPNTWKDPQEFRPERFLTKDGCFERHPHLMPFSMGKRQCLGEVLARQELFLFAATLLQKFTFLPPEGVSKLDEQGIVGFTVSPKPFHIRAILR